ncbi:DNA helicase II [Klebsormidium nitens]|uniref:DNA helicase II n=1 Tax=Klebsormidium nitens TaxID=105231 RepID=A0A1Y1ILR6_KLENI|nr:DNA helicase II [Klebsormidium nitens]|eukprot:GAQ90389.1 DNA helicase II [Klebsormidium nitens]
MPLDNEQMQVVEAPINCHIRVLSTPGGGKSSVLVARVVHLIEHCHEDASCMRIMSFSRQSAAEVASRLPEGVRCSTIHSFCSELSFRLEPTFEDPERCLIGAERLAADEEDAARELFSPDEFLFRLRDLLTAGKCKHDDVDGLRFLFVDEMQDLCPVQFDVIRLLSELFGVRVFGVGDRNQNIYGFRSSDARFLDEMEKLPSHECISFELTRNYRSLPPIISFSNALVEGRKRMVAARSAELEAAPTLTCFEHQGQELSWVVEHVCKRPAGDLAVIARTRREVFLLAHKLVERGVPNKVIVTEGDSAKLLKDSESVSLCTMHGSKGLEWPVVYLVGLNDRHNKSLLTKVEQEQEDNLLFVATTRARDELHITSPYGTVSRVISRVPRDLFLSTPPDKSRGVVKPRFSEGGRDPYVRSDRSVSSFVQYCSGALYQQMKDGGLLPRRFPGARIERLHAAHPFPKAFEDSKALYGSIVERVIFKQVDKQVRERAIRAGGSSDLLHMRSQDSHASRCFLYVRTDRLTWDTRAATEEELRVQKDALASEFGLTAEHVREYDIRSQPAYVGSKGVLYAQHADEAHARAFDGRIRGIRESYKRYIKNDVDLGTEEGLRVISDVATCAHICSAPARTHLLFKRPACGSLDMDSNLGLLQQTAKVVRKPLGPHFDKHPPQVITSPPDIAKSPYMLRTFGVATDLDISIEAVKGICDLVIGTTMVEIKASMEPGGVQIGWVLQALLYAALARERGLDIQEIAIYNPLKGFLWRAPISEWTKGPELLRLVAEETSSQPIRELIPRYANMALDLCKN